ncbi:uncharacterized protein DUF3135 [Sinobacterium caligoides]|uniref:Uncharacterized protein DUF3135 n=1 Tax=Sinobacterium caligoides TaxID=933926 RepID=A0A3N2E0Q9_9GAMM|nr:DUF3135 domain-containing protein [Sinobacterium caligoides]ROS05219.1 uncharacterized protein DUF3135 [Sinobacterium caligoides]
MARNLPNLSVLQQMARDDPAALERLRNEMVEQLINDAPERQHRRLRGLQFQIDAIRHSKRSPLRRCQILSEMMLESFAKLDSELNRLSNKRSKAAHRENNTTSTKVLPFQRRH